MTNYIFNQLAALLHRYRTGHFDPFFVEKFVKEYLPSGSGLDGHIGIDYARSNDNRIVIDVEYHHMNEYGMYDGWTNHSIIIKPHFVWGFDLRVTGKDRNDIKEYLANLFTEALHEEYKPYD
jgi:hypothetical protein